VETLYEIQRREIRHAWDVPVLDWYGQKEHCVSISQCREGTYHSLVRAKGKPEAERVGKDMLRPVLTLERLTFLEPKGKVGYRWDLIWSLSLG